MSAARKKPIEILTKGEVARILDACGSNRSTRAKRDRGCIVVMYRAGLRSFEMLALRLSDLNRTEGTIRVRRGKGGKGRVVGMDSAGWAILDKWIVARREKWGAPDDDSVPLFCTRTMRPILTQSYRNSLANKKRRAGVNKRVHAHGFRHTFAFELMKEGAPIVVIKNQLGHGSLQTTATYLDHLSETECANYVSNRRWADAPVDIPPPRKPKTPLGEFRRAIEGECEVFAFSDLGDSAVTVLKNGDDTFACLLYRAPEGEFDRRGDWSVVMERDGVDLAAAFQWYAAVVGRG